MTTSTHIPNRYRVTSVTLTQSLCPSVARSPSLRGPSSVIQLRPSVVRSPSLRGPSPPPPAQPSVRCLGYHPSLSLFIVPEFNSGFLQKFHPLRHWTTFERPRYGLRKISVPPRARFSPLFHLPSLHHTPLLPK